MMTQPIATVCSKELQELPWLFKTLYLCMVNGMLDHIPAVSMGPYQPTPHHHYTSKL